MESSSDFFFSFLYFKLMTVPEGNSLMSKGNVNIWCENNILFWHKTDLTCNAAIDFRQKKKKR